MYTITVDDKDLYIPDSEDYQVSSATISINTDSVAYLDMDIPCTNKGLKEIKQQASIVRVYDNDVLRYKMFVDNIDYDFDNTAKVSCTSVLAYLKDSLVRPYSTVDSEEGITAPSSVNGYFSWLIEQHNKNIRDTKKYFYVGVNQGAIMDRNNYIYRASTEVPTTSDEIKNKILDTYGAYISLTFNGDLNVINLYADVHDSNDQVIDFGVNLLDLTRSVSTESSYTAVRPTGAVPETENKSTSLPITISSIPDGVSKWNSDVYKKGDVVYSISGVRDYGYKECEYSNNDITDVEYLYRASVVYLNKLVNPYLTIDVKAVDLSLLYMDKYSPMEVGQAVRVRSEPHGVDEYLRISEISIDLLDPSNDSYTLGESYDSLTGQQSSYMKKLNSSINASFDIVGSAAEAASKLADAAKKTANEADKKAQDATSKANEANTKADTATETANGASAKADQASQNAQKANEAAKKAQEDATAAIGSAKAAADKAASASQKADNNTAKITTVENTIKTISGDTATAIANAKAAKDAAEAANDAAKKAQADASTANTEIGKVQSQVGTINTEIGNIKQEATDLRDDLTGQITMVKNTMEADYTRKTELSDTTATLRNEISESAAGVIHTVSQDYATKKELKTTTDATNKNTADLTNAIKKFNSDVDNLQGQIDGAIETWFYEVDPTNKNEPAVNWTTDTSKKAHLGDLYYNTVSGYCWRYQLQNGSYSWSRITDVDVTKALADAAAAQTTANSKKRIFVTTPIPPYDVGDLWTQGTTGDIMRCQTAKTSSQSYAAADWVKASKYTDDTAVETLSNTVEKTYSTKTEVKQLSDQVSSTVSSLETVRVSAEAAQTSADNAKKAADAAQTAADTAKANAATAQSKADEAASNLATAEENLKTLQSQANATDEQLTAAKAEVEKAKTAAATAQETANTAKANAATAQATADTAKANAKTAQDDVNALKNRVTSAETSIQQNSDAIALRATKTEVTNAIDGISVGGRNLLLGTAAFDATDISNMTSHDNALNNSESFRGNRVLKYNTAWCRYYIELSKFIQKYNLKGGDFVTYSIWFKFTTDNLKDTDKKAFNIIGYNGASNSENYLTILNTLNVVTDANIWKQYSISFKVPESISEANDNIRIEINYYTESDYTSPRLTQWWSSPKLELGNKSTDWSPAPEDLVSESKTYTDAQLKISADSITSTVSKTYATKTEITEAVDKNKSEIVSMGEQLVINGSGLMGDNTNFSSLIFDASKSNGSAGSFTRTGSVNSSEFSDNFFPVSPTLRYSFELDAMSSKAKASMYSFLDFYDVDKKQIVSNDHMYVENTLTTLAKDLKNGDTVVYLADMTNWLTSGGNGIFTRGFIFWNYKNSFGYTYPEHTYSKYNYVDLYIDSDINTIAKTITLKNPWTNGTFPAGTKVSQSNSGATFKYQAMGDTIPPSIWKHYSGYYDGTDYSGTNASDKFPPGTAYAKVGFLWNYNKSDDQVWVTNISVKTDYKHAIDEVATRVTNAETSIKQNSDAIALRATKTEVTEVKNTADTAKSTADAVKTDLESNYSTTTQMNSAIDLRADSITSTVSQTYLKIDDASKNYASSERVSNIESRVTQNATSITASFNSLKKQIDDKTEVVNAWITEGSDGTNPYLELGTNKSDLKTRLTNSELAFMDGTDKVAYVSNSTMSITNADINVAKINQLAIYPYQLAVKNGHLLIQYIGG